MNRVKLSDLRDGTIMEKINKRKVKIDSHKIDEGYEAKD